MGRRVGPADLTRCCFTDFIAAEFSEFAQCDLSRYRKPPAGIPACPFDPVDAVRMPKITYIDSDGTERVVDAEAGSTVMEAAIKNGVPGIEAECGGACACATCHVYVEEEWREKAGGPSPMEEDMLDFGYDVRPNSRLSCQIKVTDALDGLRVAVPERQA
jgi:2Fe-2S ferredoxin